MQLTDLVNEKTILLDFEAEDKFEIIEKLARLLDMDGVLVSYDGFYKEVLKREDEFATSIGMDTAIPHGKTDYVKRPAIAFGRLKNPIEWDPGSGDMVRIVFLLAVPNTSECNDHLAVLAALARSLIHDEKRLQFLYAPGKPDIVKAFSGIQCGPK